MKTMIVIREATKAQASDIAQLIMMAMTDDCCQHFCGVGHGLEDFLKMMTSLVEREDSQYSYRNTFVAMADNKVVGIAVSYDGGRLHELRQAFIKAAKEYIGKDHSGMDDETQAGGSTLIRWPFYQNIVAKALPTVFCMPRRRKPTRWDSLVSDCW